MIRYKKWGEHIERMVIILSEVAKNIWTNYQRFLETAFVPRTGFILWGLAKDIRTYTSKTEYFYNRGGESVLEHMCKTAELFSLIKEGYPNFTKYAEQWELWGKLKDLQIMLLHDIGEGEIGDNADDGSTDVAWKNKAERKFFQGYVESKYDKDTAKEMDRGFGSFQNKVTDPGKAGYATDKLDAVLTTFYMEKLGAIGTLDRKAYLTEQDKKCIETAGTTKAADCLAVHLKASIDGYPEHIVGPIYDILREATIDVRGEFFSWWDKKMPIL